MPKTTHGSQPNDPRMRPFVPHRGRVVATSAGVIAVLLFGAVGLLVPVTWQLGDRLLVASFGVFIAILMYRFATIRATPLPEGLVVRNLLITRPIRWQEITSIAFAGGAPWVSLGLADTDTVAVMAIQRADGARGREEAHRLADLIEQLGQSSKAPDE